MNLMDISIIDIDELGVRPPNWTDDANQFDDPTNSKSNDFKSFNLNDEKIDDSIFHEENSTFQIDPETGERIFDEVSVVSSESSSISSNDKWIEEYLSQIELPTATNQFVSPTLITDPLFENISLTNDQVSSNWFSKLISTEKSTNQTMFNDQFLSYETLNNNNNKNQSEIIYSSPSTNCQNSYVNVLHEHYISDRNRRSNSNSQDNDFSYVETKLEKFEPDEHFIENISNNRTNPRAISQGQQDEDILRRFNIPLTLFDITQSTTEEYNRHLSYLNPEQIHIVKDIRRRGKNKIAAQNCRKRKAISVGSLLEEVDELKRLKHQLEERKNFYKQQIDETRSQYEFLHRQVLPDRQLPPAIIVK